MSNSQDPIACSLPLRQAAEQALEWTDLHQHVVSTEQLEGGFAVTYRAEVSGDVENLVARESGCCSWLSLSTSMNADGIRLELASDNPDGLPVIKLLAGRT